MGPKSASKLHSMPSRGLRPLKRLRGEFFFGAFCESDVEMNAEHLGAVRVLIVANPNFGIGSRGNLDGANFAGNAGFMKGLRNHVGFSTIG